MPASLTEEELVELERLVRGYVEALELVTKGWSGAPSLLAAGAPLVMAFERHGGEHAVLLQLLASARAVRNVAESELAATKANYAALHELHELTCKQSDAFAAEAAATKAKLEALESQLLPENDATDAAHPAWWRGHDDGAKGMAALVEKLRAKLAECERSHAAAVKANEEGSAKLAEVERDKVALVIDLELMRDFLPLDWTNTTALGGQVMVKMKALRDRACGAEEDRDEAREKADKLRSELERARRVVEAAKRVADGTCVPREHSCHRLDVLALIAEVDALASAGTDAAFVAGATARRRAVTPSSRRPSSAALTARNEGTDADRIEAPKCDGGGVVGQLDLTACVLPFVDPPRPEAVESGPVCSDHGCPMTQCGGRDGLGWVCMPCKARMPPKPPAESKLKPQRNDESDPIAWLLRHDSADVRCATAEGIWQAESVAHLPALREAADREQDERDKEYMLHAIKLLEAGKPEPQPLRVGSTIDHPGLLESQPSGEPCTWWWNTDEHPCGKPVDKSGPWRFCAGHQVLQRERESAQREPEVERDDGSDQE